VIQPRILVVDDQKDFARGVALSLEDLSGDVVIASSAEEAVSQFEQGAFDLVFSDVRMPGAGGFSLLDTVRERWPRARVVLLTGFGTIEAAVDAMKRGAWDYLTKPCDEAELLMVARRAWKEMQAEDEIARLRAELAESRSFHGIFGRDRRMLAVFDAIRRVGPSRASVLIWGESGTGKELVARAIHAESPRAQGPFVAFNAAALPDTLADAELFGAKKGAYTGSDRDRKGLFVEASGGTLLIDELPSMPPLLQGKLLRALQEGEVLPLGSSAPVKVDVRVVAATNVEPSRLLRDGRLRKDLYYRLSVMRITLPPLRERVEDIPLLAELFLERSCVQAGVPVKHLSPRAVRLLVSHDWPGNVRELQNVVERATLMSRGEEIGPGEIVLEGDDLEWQPEGDEDLAYEEAKRRVLLRFQRRYVERAMADSGGNLSAAARKAGITRAALHRIVKRLGMNVDDEEGGGSTPPPAPTR